MPACPLGRPHDLGERARQALDLVALVRPFHAADVRVPQSRSWSDRLAPHLRETLPRLRQHRLREPVGWTDKLDRLSRDGDVLIHGDPAGLNVLVTEHGLLLLDPPGALRALPEADIAQICCQVGGVDDVHELLTLVAEQDPRLDPSALAGFAGLNLLVWAGYAAAAHSNPDVTRGDTTPDVRTSLDNAERHLRLGRTLLDEYRLP